MRQKIEIIKCDDCGKEIKSCDQCVTVLIDRGQTPQGELVQTNQDFCLVCATARINQSISIQQVIQCPMCEGKGKVKVFYAHDYEWEQCMVCRGKGNVI